MNKVLVHIINPVRVPPSSDLFLAQPITFESLRIAKAFNAEGMEIFQRTVQYPEDHDIIPDFLSKSSDLTSSVLDCGVFKVKKKLPLIQEIVNLAYDVANADYIIYSNVDIAVMPHFYSFIGRKIKEGVDAMVINRRTIANTFKSKDELPEMYSCIGESHPGYDCFVFKKTLAPQMILGNICIGAAYIGLALYLNIRLLSQNFKKFTDEHLTFHIGNDQQWKKKENDEFMAHNKAEFERIKMQLAAKYDNVDEIIDSAFPSLKFMKQNKIKNKNWLTPLKRFF